MNWQLHELGLRQWRLPSGTPSILGGREEVRNERGCREANNALRVIESRLRYRFTDRDSFTDVSRLKKRSCCSGLFTIAYPTDVYCLLLQCAGWG